MIGVAIFQQFRNNRYAESLTKSGTEATAKKFELVQSDNENSNQQSLVLPRCIVLSFSNW